MRCRGYELKFAYGSKLADFRVGGEIRKRLPAKHHCLRVTSISFPSPFDYKTAELGLMAQQSGFLQALGSSKPAASLAHF